MAWDVLLGIVKRCFAILKMTKIESRPPDETRYIAGIHIWNKNDPEQKMNIYQGLQEIELK